MILRHKPFIVCVAGIGILVKIPDASITQQIQVHYLPFIEKILPDIRVTVKFIETQGQPAYHEARLTFMEKRVIFEHPGYHGWIDLTRQEAYLECGFAFAFESIDYFIRVICAFMVFHRKGILVHAAGVLRGESVYLFLGHSGSGKTTTSRNSPDGLVLNDDLVVLLPEAGRWHAHSTPFWSPTQVKPNPGNGPVVGFFHLVKDKRVFLEPMSPGQALGEWITNIPVITSDPKLGFEVLSMGKIITTEIPSFKLHLLPDSTFWQELDRVIGLQIC